MSMWIMLLAIDSPIYRVTKKKIDKKMFKIFFYMWQVTGETWHVIGDMWDLTGETWHVTCDT